MWVWVLMPDSLSDWCHISSPRDVIILMCMSVLPACLSVHVCVPHVWLVSEYGRRGIGHPGTEVIDSCELPGGYPELNPGPLQERHIL